MALKLSPHSPCNRRTSLIRRISDLGLGIIPPLAKGRDDTRDYFRVSRDAPLRRGGENSGLRWRLSSASGGDLDRPQVAIWIGLGWRFASARADVIGCCLFARRAAWHRCVGRLGLWGSQRRAVDTNDDAVMLQAVEQRVDKVFFLEQLVPVGQIEIRRDDGRNAVVALIHETEERVYLFRFEG